MNMNKSTKILPFWPIKRMNFPSPQQCSLFYKFQVNMCERVRACVSYLNESLHRIDYYVYWFTAQVFISTLNSYLFVSLLLFPEFI